VGRGSHPILVIMGTRLRQEGELPADPPLGFAGRARRQMHSDKSDRNTPIRCNVSISVSSLVGIF